MSVERGITLTLEPPDLFSAPLQHGGYTDRCALMMVMEPGKTNRFRRRHSKVKTHGSWFWVPNGRGGCYKDASNKGIGNGEFISHEILLFKRAASRDFTQIIAVFIWIGGGHTSR
ncbi:DNA topoisomerase-like protein [Phytophthora palmivora]|uniref:DNA topoisomerase-like protein n=1 Tax=Phytophthora palmivora TaxID=4796 RepID=A0A2P4YUF7_9STRA|nr:DNA topoisomerase-like protein [Phytophthora palmivora]